MLCDAETVKLSPSATGSPEAHDVYSYSAEVRATVMVMPRAEVWLAGVGSG